MASRHADWLKQGQRDLAHGRRSLDAGDYEWACFAAQQGAEKPSKPLSKRRAAQLGGIRLRHCSSLCLSRSSPVNS